MAVMKQLVKVIVVAAGVGILFVVLQHFVKVNDIIQTGGLLGLGLTLFAETGLLAGFFLPGDTLLFAAGFFSAQGQIGLVPAIVTMFVAAVFGNMLGYEIGKRSGKRIFNRPDSIFFHKDNVDKANAFFNKHGGKTIILARFVPIVRTLSPLLAGVGRMPYGRFMVYNFIGALVWVPSLTMIGYWGGRVLGHYINIDHYILPAVFIATLLTFGASFMHVLRDPISRQKLIEKFKTPPPKETKKRS